MKKQTLSDKIQSKNTEHSRSVVSALAFSIGFSLLLIGFVLMMRTLLAPKQQFTGNSSVDQFEQDQEGQFYQNQQNVSDPTQIQQADNQDQ